ncbi:MAG: response regulator transcription factor [Saprospiraceae bacterium]|nr:response regulator transcription factor [Saprospiraceae bacterium]
MTTFIHPVKTAYPKSTIIHQFLNMEKQSTIKIAIIEDLKDVAFELKELFNEVEDMNCQQIYHTAEEAMAFLPQNPADVVIVDIGLPGASGIEAIITLREQLPNSQFCMFTVFEDDEKIFKSLKAGAKGYILKNSSPEKILTSARELHQGGSPMNPEIARKVIDAFTQPKQKTAKSSNLPLTKREFQLLEHLSRGLLYKEIAQELGITTGTVKQHIHKIYDKLQVNNRTEAINLFLDR